MATNIVDSIKEKYLDSTFHESQWSLKEIITPDLVRKQYLDTCRKRKRAAVELSPYSYRDLFTTQDAEKAIKKIVIEGKAGFGKTILCVSITRDWAAGKLFQQFELLLMLPIHEKKLASVASIDALFSLVYDANTCAFIVDYLERHGEKVLIIVDGWDAMPSAPEQQKKCCLYNILFGDRFPTISVLVTSRPSTALRALPFIDQFIELCGFNRETIKWCIQSYFSNKKEVADNLLEQFESNPLIENVCSVPLDCAIICDMMDSNEQLTLPNTTTELYYNNLILHIINNTIAESNSFVNVSNLPDDLMLPWQSLCEIAFQAVFPAENEIQAHSMNLSSSNVAVDRIFDFGLVKSISEDAEGKLTFHFYHPIIKSYLAAQHLVQQPRDIRLSIIRSHASLRQLTMVWRYLFGIYFREINSMNVDRDFIKRCIQILAARHISSREGYNLCHYSFEARNKIVSDEVYKAFTTIKRQCPANLSLIHFGSPRTAHDCAAVLYFIANIEQKTCIELNFSHCLAEKQLRELAHLLDSKQSIVQLKALHLSDNQFSDEVIVDCFMKFVSTFKFMEKLFLRNCHIGQPGMDVIITVIILASRTLKVLDLSYNSVSLYGLIDTVLSGALSNIEIMFLQGSVVEQEDTSCLASFSEALLSHCKYLRRLDLSANNFGDPRNPGLGRVISQVTSICENFDLVLDRQYNPF